MMIHFATAAAVKAAVALTAATASATLLTGTAQAATPGLDTATTAAAATNHVGEFPRFDPRRRVFRAHFRTYGECVFFANHDRNPRTNGWDCRRGGDRNFPWEYWY
jgi:hypothetical protein